MRPIDALSPERAQGLKGVFFDLDDTVLDGGALTEAAYGALFRLRDAGLRAVAVTGRPAGWGDLIARMWPIDGAISENGAVASIVEDGRVRRLDAAGPARPAKTERLVSLVQHVRTQIPTLVPADDGRDRLSDFSFDIAEFNQASPEDIRRAVQLGLEAGARVIRSSIHLHFTFDADDKASGAIRFAVNRLGEDPTSARFRFAFIGDSENDSPAFAGFATTIGVANLRRGSTVEPRYITRAGYGAGFAEAISAILARRTASA